jgi:predicted HNH restriction endonuclease
MKNLIQSLKRILNSNNYIRKSIASQRYRFKFEYLKLQSYIEKFDENFNLIIIGHDEQETDFFIIPYSSVKSIFTQQNLAQVKNNSKSWLGRITNNKLRVSNCSTVIDVSNFYGNVSFLASITEAAQLIDNHISTLIFPEEVSQASKYSEGSTKQIYVNVYERNLKARQECLEYYGAKCYVCGFQFARVYGKIGENFIHVHHLKPLSEINQEYEVDPIKDLRPVCPNCHAMLHRRKQTYTIEQLKNFIAESRTGELLTSLFK